MSKFGGAPKCARCTKSVYFNEQLKAVNKVYHQACFKCLECTKSLDLSNYTPNKDNDIFCARCYATKYGPEGFRTGGSNTVLKTTFQGDKQREEELEKKRQIEAQKTKPAPVQSKPNFSAAPAPAKKKFCTECGTPNDGGRFCAECGTPA